MDCLICSYIFSKGESETVFTTCINNNIGNGLKMPHDIDANSQLFEQGFMLEFTLDFMVIYQNKS